MILEEQRKSQERIEDLLELLEKRYLTQDELTQILKRGEDRGKAIVIPEPEIQTQPKEKTSESKQLSIRPPSTYF